MGGGKLSCREDNLRFATWRIFVVFTFSVMVIKWYIGRTWIIPSCHMVTQRNPQIRLRSTLRCSACFRLPIQYTYPNHYVRTLFVVWWLSSTTVNRQVGSSNLPRARAIWLPPVVHQRVINQLLAIGRQGRTQDFRRGGVPRSAKEANKPNKRATELKPRTCAHQGSMFRPYTSVCFVESSIFTALV